MLINTRKHNNKSRGNKIKAFYPQRLCVAVVLWQLQCLNLLSALAGRRGALCLCSVTLRRHFSARLFSLHACLHSENSIYDFFCQLKQSRRTTTSSHYCSRYCAGLMSHKPWLFYFCLCITVTLHRGKWSRGKEEGCVLLGELHAHTKIWWCKILIQQERPIQLLNLPISVSPPCP